ncbi:hypothetical protein RB3991 [Rhodopirellula baltica SH 1]|uniref:Uncharacterized protein n=1 Tax=Rhodopirellula baltica (strain DSM 10527 / NCIMB 13988 / SH1) TaxID=243090 RepID=Q7UTA8_RHOBA|nr:hypothetical protein RB3991 [Rhodopirellula baltica SH 1]
MTTGLTATQATSIPASGQLTNVMNGRLLRRCRTRGRQLTQCGRGFAAAFPSHRLVGDRQGLWFYSGWIIEEPACRCRVQQTRKSRTYAKEVRR